MKANVIEGCISCGLCASVCPEVFRMNDENVSEVYHQRRRNRKMPRRKPLTAAR